MLGTERHVAWSETAMQCNSLHLCNPVCTLACLWYQPGLKQQCMEPIALPVCTLACLWYQPGQYCLLSVSVQCLCHHYLMYKVTDGTSTNYVTHCAGICISPA